MSNVMIAEDSPLLADMLTDVLSEAGYDVCGVARTVEEGVELVERFNPDLAVLDLRLAEGGLGTEIAARFDRASRPGILYATGNVGQLDLTRADGEACLGKPYRPADVLQALSIVKQIISTGDSSRPFPRAFYKLLEPLAADPSIKSGNLQRAEIRRLRRQQAALATFGSFALGETDLGKVLTEAARVCAESLEVPFCKICRYRAEENDFLLEAGVGWNQGVIGCVVSRADESSPQGRAFISGTPVTCDNLREDTRFMLPPFYAEHGIISTMDIIIIKKEGRPYGVLGIDSRVPHIYDHHDVDFLTGFANVLAEAVETSRRNIALRASVERMREMVAERDQLLAAKNLILEEKDVMAQELRHRVRNNLQLVHGMISKQLHITTDVAGKAGLSAILRRIMALAQVYNHLLGIGLNRTIDFGAYLSSLCSNIESLQMPQTSDVTLICNSEQVFLDLDSVTTLGLIISEMISSSYEHAFPDGRGTITMSLSRSTQNDEATILFSDDGVGFIEDGSNKRHGLGLVKRLMQQLSGSALLRSDHGSEWTLTFPVPHYQQRRQFHLTQCIPTAWFTCGKGPRPRGRRRRQIVSKRLIGLRWRCLDRQRRTSHDD